MATLVAIAACGGTSAQPVQSALDPELTELIASLTGEKQQQGGEPGLIDEFWTVAAPTYAPPTSVRAYRGGEVPDGIACGNQDDAESWRQGAFYCPTDATLVYDVDWLHELYRSSGPLAPIGVIAHEWGHHVQQQNGSGERSIQNELMADCFAGMFASASDEEATQVLQMADFYRLGNESYDSSTWFQANEHWSANQRAAAWALGYLTMAGTGIGFSTCIGYGQWKPGRVEEIGPYRFVELPGRLGTLDDDAVYRVTPTDGAPGFSIDDLDLPTGSQAATVAQEIVGAPDVELIPVNVAAAHGEAVYYAAPGGRHGLVGLIASPDAETTLVVHVEGRGTVTSVDAPSPGEYESALAVTNLGLILLGQVCAPGQEAEAATPSERFNAYCATDL